MFSVGRRDVGIDRWPQKCRTNNLLVLGVNDVTEVTNLRVCVTKGFLHAAMFLVQNLDSSLAPPRPLRSEPPLSSV